MKEYSTMKNFQDLDLNVVNFKEHKNFIVDFIVVFNWHWNCNVYKV